MDIDITKLSVSQVGEGFDCSEIFEVLKVLRDLEKDLDYENRTRKSKIYNRFSGSYFSPTFVKSFLDCPAKSFISNCLPRTVSPIANFGSCVHKVFERVLVEKTYDSFDRSLDIANEEGESFSISKSNQKILNEKYLVNFLQSRDYLNLDNPLDWDNIEMFSEAFYKSEISIFEIPLGPCYTLIDRIDIRDEGIFLFDYKTGPAPYNSLKVAELIESYIDQMIAYSWQIEHQYGIKPKGVYAYIPDNNSYIEFPVNSLKLQSMFVEKIIRYYSEIKEQRENAYFEQRINRYCRYCPVKDICNKYNKTDNKLKINIDLSKI